MEFDLIQYYCREKYYHTMQVVAESALKNLYNPVIKLQFCVSLIFQNRIGEALRELESLMTEPDINLSVMITIIYAQNLCEVPDGEVLVTLESKVRTERKRAGELALYYAANFFLQCRDFEQLSEYSDMLSRMNRNSVKSCLIKGWSEFHKGKFTMAADSFRTVLTQDAQNLNAAFGEILSLSLDDAITRLNQLIVKYPKLTPPLLEKMKLLLRNEDWDQTLDIISRILTVDSSCILALEIKILNNLCVRGSFESLSNDSETLILAIKHQEPNNWEIYYEFSRVLVRSCGCNLDLLKESIKFIEEAVKLVPENITVKLELAHQNYLLKNYQKAANIYKEIARADDSASEPEALIGLTRCRLVEANLKDEVNQQINFLREIIDYEQSPELLLLLATNESEKNAKKLITQAIKFKFKAASSFKFGIPFLITLDATFILEAVTKLTCPSSISYRIDVLRRLLHIIPGFIEAWLLLSEMYIKLENYEEADTVLRHILNDLDSQNADANLKLARILIHQEKFDEAKSTLDLCLSHNLNVRSKPLFHFLLGKIQKNENNFRECVNSMRNALNYVTEVDYLEPLDVATLYLDLSSCYQFIEQPEEATESIEKAAQLLEGTSEQDKLLIARADLELWKNDINKALSLLSSVTSSSPMYLEARTKMADIHLKYNKDLNKYIEFHKNLVEEFPTQENYFKLADAYFSIRRIPEAIEIYEKMIKQKPSPKLSKKLAELYCRCHRYGDAVRCFREAGAEGSLDLAQLLFSLKQWERAELTLAQVPLLEKALLLSKIKEKIGDIPAALNILNEAYTHVGRNNDPLAAQICRQMAEYESKTQDAESAIRHFKLALSYCEGNASESSSIKISLSKLYSQVNDLNACQTICSSLLAEDANNELALLMSADLSFRKCDFLSACNLFHRLLAQKPSYWLALARMIEVKRRLGCLKEAKVYLDGVTSNNRNEPGFLYCSGLYNWFGNNLSDAVKFFGCIKHDLEWGQQALHNIVEIYLLLGNEHHEKAESMLQEIRPNSVEEETNRSLLANFVRLSSKDKQSVEKAVTELLNLASRGVLRVGASLGLAIGYTLQKQPQRARNVLKMMKNTAWQFEEAEYLERCWLMYADHHVQSGKHELAHELIKKILYYNNGCAKAHELYGVIAEKDQKYGNATQHYLKAWTICEQRDPALGYRLGMYFMKSKQYADAISTCQDILKKYPDNVKLKKDVYEKSLALLRT